MEEQIRISRQSPITVRGFDLTLVDVNVQLLRDASVSRNFSLIFFKPGKKIPNSQRILFKNCVWLRGSFYVVVHYNLHFTNYISKAKSDFNFLRISQMENHQEKKNLQLKDKPWHASKRFP